MSFKVPRAARRHEPREARLPYLPGLDGLRALAVTAVLVYHAGMSLRGGFLGVEIFFVLSGFLITALLLTEWRQHGRIDLSAFWLRRARRLLPALALVLGGVLAIAGLLPPGEATGLGGDLLAALGYVMNWHLVLGQQSYFDPMVRPSLLQHLWSLAVEEQFYLIWPVLFVLGMRWLRPAGLLAATLAVAGASAALMAWLYEPGADPSRLYYGTDTRAAGLLLGAALALAWTPGQSPLAERRAAGLALDVAGLAALTGLAAAVVWMYEYHPLLYRGGFGLVAAGTIVLIVATTHPRARLLPALLGWRPLRWIGVRSYGIYLWHWPIFQITRPYQDLPFDGPGLLALRLAIVLALAELSYRLVELPVRHGAIEQAWQRFWSTRRAPAAPGALRSRRRQSVLILSMLAIFTAACGVPIQAQLDDTSAPTTPAIAAVATAPAASAPLAIATVEPAASAAPIAASATAAPTLTPSPTAIASPTAEPASTPEAAPAEAALQPFDPALAAELQRVLDQTVADGYIPGAVLSVHIPGYETWSGASGTQSRQQGQQMEPTTRVRVASISKIFTAVVVLQLVEEGVISLDAPVETWLPGLLPQGDAITVRNLLNHTSGLYDYLEDRSFVNQAYQQGGRAWSPRELVAYATQFPLAFQPGAEGAWDYSSTNYVLLGMIVEQATGNTLATEMRQRVFDPIGLESTYFTPDEQVQGNLSNGYSNTLDQSDASMSFVYATANIVSTASDVQRFVQALVGGELLGPATLEQMYGFVNGKGQYNMPALAYGLGIMRNQLPVGPGPDGQPRPAEDITVLGHIGGYGGFRAAVWSAPASGITIALGVNQAATDPNQLATQAWNTVLSYQGR